MTPENFSPPSHPLAFHPGPHALDGRLASIGILVLRAGCLGQSWPRPGQHSFPFIILSPCRKGYSPIWDCATRVEVRSHSGEKGRPSSASLSPWGRRQGKAGEDTSDYQIQGEAGVVGVCCGKRGISVPVTWKSVICKWDAPVINHCSAFRMMTFYPTGLGSSQKLQVAE